MLTFSEGSKNITILKIYANYTTILYYKLFSLYLFILILMKKLHIKNYFETILKFKHEKKNKMS